MQTLDGSTFSQFQCTKWIIMVTLLSVK